jgi:serine/threonine-protein kinase
MVALWLPLSGAAEILHEHLQLRQQYPGARLLWSDDWSTFSKQPDFWVTVVGIGFRDQSSAQAWCTDHKLDRDHCFPTLIRR